jgi:hypothetical protein
MLSQDELRTALLETMTGDEVTFYTKTMLLSLAISIMNFS